MSKIYELKTVEILILESNPPQVLILATGLANSSGWTNGQLNPHEGTPKDGVYEFDFVANTPARGTINMPVLTEISASIRIKNVPDQFKGVVVYAQQNKMEQFTAKKRINENELASQSLGNGLEPLLGATILEDRIIFRVRTGGCTDKDDFDLKINRGITGMPLYFVSLYRKTSDHCRGYFPEGIELTYTFEELELKKDTDLVILNSIAHQFRGRIPSQFPHSLPQSPINWPINPFPGPWPSYPWYPWDPRNPWGPNIPPIELPLNDQGV